MRLVRNSYGFPINEGDGTVLFDINSGPLASGTVDAPRTDYIDTPLAPGRFYYYTLWVYGLLAYNGRNDWRRAGNVIGLSVQDWGYTQRLNSLLPTVYTTDLNVVDSQSFDNDTVLYRFLSLMGFQLDYTRSQYETLQSVNDPTNVSGGLLPLMANQYGLTYEPELGMAQLRVLLRNIQHIYKIKGTATGVQALVHGYSGWGAQINQGINLILDYNDSSYEESLGRWVAGANTTAALYVADGTIAAFSTGSNKSAGLMKLTATASATISATLAATNAVTTGIPVNEAQQYCFSIYARAGTTGRSVTAAINWYDMSGVLLSTSTGSAVSNVSGAWTARPFVTAPAPIGTVYAGLKVSVASAVNTEIHYLDGAQFETGGSASTFQEARDLRVVITADRVNEITNPSFEVNTTGWTTTGSTTIARTYVQGLYGTANRTDTATVTNASATVTDASIAAADNGKPVSGLGIPANTYVGTVTPGVSFLMSSSPTSQVNVNGTATNVGTPIVLSQAASLKVVTDSSASAPYAVTPIVSGLYTYTASVWVYGPAGNYRISHAQHTPTAGGTVIDGPLTSVATNNWTRLSGTFTVPTNETAARWLIKGPASSTFYVDGVMVERGSVLGTYFDASQGGTHPADYLWEGTTHASRSHYYSNRTAKTYRLTALLGQYLWAGMTFTLLVAQPGT